MLWKFIKMSSILKLEVYVMQISDVVKGKTVIKKFLLGIYIYM